MHVSSPAEVLYVSHDAPRICRALFELRPPRSWPGRSKYTAADNPWRSSHLPGLRFFNETNNHHLCVLTSALQQINIVQC